MRVSAKVDYALRAMAELAAAPPGLTTAERLASAQHIPPKFLESILAQLRTGGLVASQRGAPPLKVSETIIRNLRVLATDQRVSEKNDDGKTEIKTFSNVTLEVTPRIAEKISVAEVIRELEGPIATVRGVRPDELEYDGAAEGLRDVWLELRTQIRGVLEHTTLADIAAAQRKT